MPRPPQPPSVWVGSQAGTLKPELLFTVPGIAELNPGEQ